MAKLIKSCGRTDTVKPAYGKFTLHEMKVAVGGFIRYIPCGENVAVVNDDGEELDLPYNLEAARLMNRHIYGDMLLCKKEEIH